MQQHLYEHYQSEGHNGFLGDVSTSPIDKTDGFQPKKNIGSESCVRIVFASFGDYLIN